MAPVKRPEDSVFQNRFKSQTGHWIALDLGRLAVSCLCSAPFSLVKNGNFHYVYCIYVLRSLFTLTLGIGHYMKGNNFNNRSTCSHYSSRDMIQLLYFLHRKYVLLWSGFWFGIDRRPWDHPPGSCCLSAACLATPGKSRAALVGPVERPFGERRGLCLIQPRQPEAHQASAAVPDPLGPSAERKSCLLSDKGANNS